MESISRISTLLESARELTIDAAQSARAARLMSTSSSAPKAASPVQIRKLLDSRSERDVLDGLRKLMGLMALPAHLNQTLPLFPTVITLIASPSLPIRKLIYIYLLAHAEHSPDLALLSINTIQKSLSHASPAVRALALSTMAGIRVPVISQIVALAIKKGVGDMSPVVRRAAGLAVGKCYRLDPSTSQGLTECVATLLMDRTPTVVGAGIRAWCELGLAQEQHGWDMLHPVYRSMVRKIIDMDEWSQVEASTVLEHYARRCFPRRRTGVTARGGTNSLDAKSGPEHDPALMDPDLELLLRHIRPLLQSRNSAVVVTVARLFNSLGTEEHSIASIGPLIALLRSSHDIQQVALHNIVAICLARPKAFVKHITHFLIRAADPPQVWGLKLEILTLVFPHADTYLKSLVLNELEHFSRGTNAELVRASVRAIGRCAQSDSQTSARCLRLLLDHVSSPDGNLVAESLTVVRYLIQQDPQAHRHTVIRLAKNLDTTTDANARATIIWLVGEFAGSHGEEDIAADVLRILAKDFASEAEPARLQIVLLAAKTYLHHLNKQEKQVETKTDMPGPVEYPSSLEEDAGFREGQTTSTTAQQPQPEHAIARLWQYIILLARYDTSYDLRDRTRLYRSLFATPNATQLASLMLLSSKSVPGNQSPIEMNGNLALGSASLMVGDRGGVHGLPGHTKLPEWVQEGHEPDPRLRDTENGSRGGAHDTDSRIMTAAERLSDAARDVNGGSMQDAGLGITGPAAGRGQKSLDDWLAEEEQANKADLDAQHNGEATDACETDSEESDVDDESDDDEDDEAEEEEEEEEEETSSGDEEQDISDDDGGAKKTLLPRAAE